MAHKTLIGGTAYEISGGKTLIDGTAYKIVGGKTLVSGTTYDIAFMPVITISGNPTILPHPSYASWVYLVHDDGTVSLVPNGKNLIPKGTVLRCFVGAWSGLTAKILKNGETIFSYTCEESSSNGFIPTRSYDYTVTSNATIKCESRNLTGARVDYGIITITEE